jgi:hypothetical protein
MTAQLLSTDSNAFRRGSSSKPASVRKAQRGNRHRGCLSTPDDECDGRERAKVGIHFDEKTENGVWVQRWYERRWKNK